MIVNVRFVQAVLLVIVGCWVIVSFLRQGLHPEILIGLVLGVAMVALGVHKVSLILRVWKAQQ